MQRKVSARPRPLTTNAFWVIIKQSLIIDACR